MDNANTTVTFMNPDSEPSQPAVLKARKITVKFGSSVILDGVDFVAKSHQLIGVLGPSGSGKSTLLMALSGFRPANEGSVLFNSEDLYDNFESLKRGIGFVPQDDVVPTSLKVERVLKYAADLRLPDLSPEVREGRVNGVITKMGLSERRKLRVNKLSGGQRKRVSVACELLSRPDLFFADEPTSGLDPALELSMMQLLREMANEGRIIIVTTHIMTSLALLDLVCLLNKGQLAYFGPPDQIKNYFQVSDFSEIYHLLGTRPPTEWRNAFQKHPLFTEYLSSALRSTL